MLILIVILWFLIIICDYKMIIYDYLWLIVLWLLIIICNYKNDYLWLFYGYWSLFVIILWYYIKFMFILLWHVSVVCINVIADLLFLFICDYWWLLLVICDYFIIILWLLWLFLLLYISVVRINVDLGSLFFKKY